MSHLLAFFMLTTAIGFACAAHHASRARNLDAHIVAHLEAVEGMTAHITALEARRHVITERRWKRSAYRRLSMRQVRVRRGVG